MGQWDRGQRVGILKADGEGASGFGTSGSGTSGSGTDGVMDDRGGSQWDRGRWCWGPGVIIEG